IAEAAKGIAAWFPGTLLERFLLEEQLESTIVNSQGPTWTSIADFEVALKEADSWNDIIHVAGSSAALLDNVGCPVTHRSTFEYCVFLGDNFYHGLQSDMLPCLVLELRHNIVGLLMCIHSSLGFVNDKANALGGTHSKPVSFVNILNFEHVKKKANFRLLENSERIADSDLVFPMSTIEEAHNMYANSLYGHFVGKCLVFPIVENYVNNMWAKFVFQEIMMNVDGFFFLKFAARAGLEQVVHVWVKLDKVPIVPYSKDGLSLIATQIEPEVVAIDNQDDGFIEVTRKNNKGKKADKSLLRHIDGLKLNKPKPKYFYHPKEKKSHDKEMNKDDEINTVKLKNHLDALSQQEAIFSETSGGETSSGNGATNKHDDPNLSFMSNENKDASNSEVDKAYNETNISITSATNSKWASTPVTDCLNV
ncbi:hypothetical protein Tco_1219826, partial [Tanacetum coccineum]